MQPMWYALKTPITYACSRKLRLTHIRMLLLVGYAPTLVTAFSVAEPWFWDSLPPDFRWPRLSYSQFRQSQKAVESQHSLTNKLQRVLSAAARITSDRSKFDRGLMQLLHEELHWLDFRDRVTFKLVVTVHRCLNSPAPQYLAVHPLSNQWHVRSAEQSCGCWAFGISGPSACNSLPDPVSSPNSTEATFWCLLKTFLFARC